MANALIVARCLWIARQLGLTKGLRMPVIQNKWIEKQKKKKVHEAAPAYEFDTKDTWVPVGADNSPKRHTNAARAMYKHTLRGVRK